jgi:hypothetical protein
MGSHPSVARPLPHVMANGREYTVPVGPGQRVAMAPQQGPSVSGWRAGQAPLGLLSPVPAARVCTGPTRQDVARGPG